MEEFAGYLRGVWKGLVSWLVWGWGEEIIRNQRWLSHFQLEKLVGRGAFLHYLQAWWLTLQKLVLTSPFTNGATRRHQGTCPKSQLVNVEVSVWPCYCLQKLGVLFPLTSLLNHDFSVAGFKSPRLLSLDRPSVFFGSSLCSKHSFCLENSVPYLYIHLATSSPSLEP